MNDKTGGIRGARRAGALAVMAAVAVLTAACGASQNSVNGGSAASGSAASATFAADLAFAQCMQTHGVPNFPDPNPSSGFGFSKPPSGATGANNNSPQARTFAACKHLLPRSGTPSSNSAVVAQQLAEAVKFAQCVRTHGVPKFPGPTVVNGSVTINTTPSVVESAQFQAALKACRSEIPKGANIP